MKAKTVKVEAINRGTGAVLVYTGPDREMVQHAVERGLKMVDYQRSPSITQHACELKSGMWEARLQYFGLD